MKKLRVGVVGVGYLGKYHAQKYAMMDNVDLVGVVDVKKDLAERTAEKLGTKALTDYRDLFGKTDAVSIVVPTFQHYGVAMDFLKNHIHVLIEKPMTTSTKEADQLICFAKENKLIIQVGHLERFNPAVVALQDIVEKPMFIESHRLSLYKNRCTDVNVVLDLMIHDIDIILHFVRSEIKSIHAAGVPVISGHVDIANARLEFDSGCVANVTASRISTKNERKIRLFQKDTYVSVDFAKKGIVVIQKKASAKDGIIPGMHIEQIDFSEGDALEKELQSFVRAVIDHKTPEVTGQMGRDALNIALNIVEQINDTGHRILHTDFPD